MKASHFEGRREARYDSAMIDGADVDKSLDRFMFVVKIADGNLRVIREECIDLDYFDLSKEERAETKPAIPTVKAVAKAQKYVAKIGPKARGFVVHHTVTLPRMFKSVSIVYQ